MKRSFVSLNLSAWRSSTLALAMPLIVLVVMFSMMTEANGQSPSGSVTTDDPAARAEMELVLQALGGRQAWRAVHNVKVHASVSDGRDKQVHELYMLDDWSTSDVQYRRHIVGSPNPVSEHSATNPWKVKVNGAEKTVQEFDQATELISQMPGAAAEILLRKKEYVLVVIPSPTCATTDVCIGVSLKNQDGSHIMPIQEWIVSKTTNLPERIRFAMHGPSLPLRQHWETVSYQAFANLGAILYPSQTTVLMPSGLKNSIVYAAPKVNVDYASENLNGEAAQ